MKQHFALICLFVLALACGLLTTALLQSHNTIRRLDAANTVLNIRGEVPFSTSITIHDTNSETSGVLFSMFNTQLGQEQQFLGTLASTAKITRYQPRYYSDSVIVGFGEEQYPELAEVPLPSRAIGNMYLDDNGQMVIQSIVLGLGSWDR